MNVLLTARYPVGGIQTFFRYIYGNDRFDDVSLHVLAPDNGLRQYLEQYIPEARLTLEPAGDSSRSLLSKTRSQLRTGHFDLVHSHGFTAGLLTELARFGVRIPHLMTAHDVFLERQFQGLKGKLRKKGMGLLFQRMSGIHTVTEEARRNFLEFFPSVSSSRIHGILHGVDAEYFRNGRARDLHSEYGVAPGTPMIGFFGRFMAQKGFRDLVEAVRIIVEDEAVKVKPVVITFGWGGYIREDYAYLTDRGLEEYFIQAPKTDDMAGSLKGVDVVAMPSKWEACGLLAMEALAAGVPVVGTSCVGLNEVLKGSPAYCVAPGDPEALAEALSSAVQPGEYERFAQYQDEACSRFNIERPAGELRELYSQLLSHSG